MELKERNQAGDRLIVGSLQVLGDLDSKNLRTVRRDVNLMQDTQIKINSKIDNYWDELSNDGVITPTEKIALRKEWEGITQTYAALYSEASQKQILNTPYWLSYQDAYDALKKCLFTDEKLFDLMESTTTLRDKDAFDEAFSEYYYAEQFVNLGITTGLIDKLGLRALTSLEEEGTNGELAFYRGELYQYVEDTWVKIGTETYLGIVNALSELPEIKQEGQYFIAGQVFTVSCPLVINGKILEINTKTFMIKYLEYAAAGQILYWHNDRWNLAADDDPRYIAVLADYLKVTGGMPALFNEQISDIVEEVMPPPPTYLGVLDVAPENPKKDNYFLYSGVNVGDWVKARIYKYNGTYWVMLDPTNDGDSEYYMNALQDILILEEAGSGYFSILFCNAFFANKASINALKVQTIYLKDTGNIQSEETSYVYHTRGLLIDANGNIDANGDTHIGGTCVIDGNTTIGGNVNVGGSATFSGKIDTVQECFAAGFELRGLQPGGYSLKILNAANGNTYWQIPASGTIRMAGTVSTTGGNGGGADFLVNGVTVNSVYLGTDESTGVDFNITVNAGDVIGVHTYGVGGGVVGQGYTTFSGGLYTATRNSLVSFLGQVVSSPNPPSPIR